MLISGTRIRNLLWPLRTLPSIIHQLTTRKKHGSTDQKPRPQIPENTDMQCSKRFSTIPIPQSMHYSPPSQKNSKYGCPMVINSLVLPKISSQSEQLPHHL